MRRFIRSVRRSFTKAVYGVGSFVSKVGWALNPVRLTRAGLRGVKRFFMFHTPSWVLGLETLVQPPESNPQFVHFLNPIYWFLWTKDFLYSWLVTRPLASMGPALPALVMVAVVGFLWHRQGAHEVSRSHRYRNLLTAAINRADYDQAAVLVGALIDFDPENENYRFQRAIVEEKRGEMQIATEYMQRLLATKNSPDAAYWLAVKQYDLTKVSTWTLEQHQAFRGLMSIALSRADKNRVDDRQLTMAKYLISIQANSDALIYVARLTSTNPDLLLPAAMLSLAAGRRSDAKDYAARAANYLRDQLKVSPADKTARMSLARALMIENRHADAIQTLLDGKKLLLGKEFDNALAEAYMVWAEKLKKDELGEETLLKRLTLISEAVKLSPANELVTDAIIGIATECRKNENKELNTLLLSTVRGVDPTMLHFILGSIALLDGDTEKAESHLVIAAKQNPNMAGILNNLAVAIHTKSDGNLEESLRFAQMANELLPGHPYLLETRGQILVKMGRYQDAIVDLEKVLPTRELWPELLPSLVKAYREVGLEDLAKQYETTLQRLEVAKEDAATAAKITP